MADFTSSGWGSGATVTVYARDAFGNQTGSSVTSGTASSAGTVTFSGLADSGKYVATDGSRTVRFGTPPASSGSSAAAALGTQPPVNITALPGAVSGLFSYNAVAFVQDNVCTDNGVQYAVWTDDRKKPVIAKRTLPDGVWQSYDLSRVFSPTTTADDPHNAYVVAIDSAGFVHVVGNLHDTPLTSGVYYVKSTAPGDITSWTTLTSMVGTNEGQMSYPTFLRLGNGDLLFFYRDGVSGNGDVYANRYSGGAWSRVGMLLQGKPTPENAYLNRIALGRDGMTVHLFYCWRSNGGSADTNNDICHIKSTDGGATWKDMAGTTLTLPVTHATSPLVVDTPATGSGMVNQNGADVDINGNPHAVFLFYDANGKTQIRHVWHDGNAWHADQATNFTYRMSTLSAVLDERVARPSVVCSSERTFIIYRSEFDGRRGQIRLLDVTPNVTSYGDFPIASLDTYGWEPVFDTRAARERNELHMFVSPVRFPDDTSQNATWVNVWGAILSVDLARAAIVARGDVELPHIRPLRSAAYGGAPLTSNSATLAATTLPKLILDGQQADKTLLIRARATARMDAAAATGKIAVAQPQRIQLDLASTTKAIIPTPWVPLDLSGDWSAGTTIPVLAQLLTGTANVEITDFNLDLGVLQGPGGPLYHYPFIPVPPGQPFDGFGGPDGTNLANHKAETGEVWTYHPVGTNPTGLLINNMLRCGDNTAIAINSWVPAVGNQVAVECDLLWLTATAENSGVAAGIHPTLNTLYTARMNRAGNQVEILKLVNGTGTSIATAAHTINVGTTYRIRLELRPASQKLYIDGALKCSATDTAITTGSVGFRLAAVAGTTDTTGLRYDNWTAKNL